MPDNAKAWKIKKLLQDECDLLAGDCSSLCKKQVGRIVWKASLYHSCSPPNRIADIQKILKQAGFQDVISLNSADNDLRSGLSGVGRNAKEMEKSLSVKRNKKRIEEASVNCESVT